MKIVQFGLHHSPNTGDGIIAECMVHGIRSILPEAQVVTVDISGRSAAGDVTVQNRGRALRLLAAMPRPMRHAAVRVKLGRMLGRAEPAWRTALENADLALIGGGQIFSDADLNFPLKLGRLGRLLARAKVPAAIHGAGVSANWSRPGTALFKRLLECDLRRVGLRDAPSIAAWTAQMGGASPVPVDTPDPGLLAAECYGAGTAGETIGLCVTAPQILGYHADGAVTGTAGGGGAEAFFGRLALTLIARGHPVRMFCNGAEEDRAALAALKAAPTLAAARRAGTLSFASPPALPSELAAIVRGCRAIIAHRLHACIIGYSYERCVIGLGWDRKVESFFEAAGLTHAFVGRADAAPADVAAVLETALASGIDGARHAQMLRGAREALAAALSEVAPLTPPRQSPPAGASPAKT
ncbi:polysaccharide pyruvyl transferase family protein [Profundibacterium mesophilum]|uniref:Polysaccharide pyruvyl transferase n=1 Tax=Profundibacterium mesophilum KAUST100406-0324 TaxID=1037889 RepID=A0A921TE30_9RHOB|nr:polysaccharide pyruvyl transferase family protein [Profundibacterium mesophilum]KAF0676936.1 polysaccharide pyruvyl transferase [Profundibacterium mesophilum KAUST100406-0324]